MSEPHMECLRLGKRLLHLPTGEWRGEPEAPRLEPKVTLLLQVLAERPGVLRSKDELEARLWPDTVVGEDTLARTVSKLRRALVDESFSGVRIDTLAKRGYRLSLLTPDREAVQTPTPTPVLAPEPASVPPSANPQDRDKRIWLGLALGCLLIAAVFLIIWWPAASSGHADTLRRADDFYAQYTRSGNASARRLYEQVLANAPDQVGALAGLANALVQEAVRWQREPATAQADYTRLGDAWAAGHLETPAATALLQRAQHAAMRAVTVAPHDAAALKALGFVLMAQGRFREALARFDEALREDPEAWGVLINKAEVLDLLNQPEAAFQALIAAHAAMTRVYGEQTVRVQPWYAELGVLIATRHQQRGELAEAEHWLREVLAYAPAHVAATRALAQLLARQDLAAEARALCEQLRKQVADAHCP